MKTKRTVLSVIVVLSVFFLSVIFDINHLNAAKVSKNTNDTLTAESNALTEDTAVTDGNTEDAEIQSFAYKMDTVNTLSAVPASENEAQSPSSADAPELSGDDLDTSGSADETVSSTADETLTASAALTETPEATQAATDTPASDSSENEAGTEASLSVPADQQPAAETAAVTDPAQPEASKPEQVESKYSDIGIATADSYVNIRKSPSTDSEVLGKLYKDSAAKILETKDDWYLVESGSVKGYVKCEYLKTGISDKELIKKYGTLSIIVKTDGLNVREKPDTDSEKVDVIYMNETYPVLEQLDGWVKVNITDDKVTGYIKSEYADVIVDFKDAVSKEEEEELKKLESEERAKKETEIKYNGGINYSNEDLKLLACLVHAEAGGQSYEGKLAVANIVLNRVKSSKFPDSIKDVIYSPGQFSVASSGSLAKQLANYDNYDSNSQLLSIKAAREALEGANNVGKRLYFNSYKSALRNGYDDEPNCVKIDDQLFW